MTGSHIDRKAVSRLSFDPCSLGCFVLSVDESSFLPFTLMMSARVTGPSERAKNSCKCGTHIIVNFLESLK